MDDAPEAVAAEATQDSVPVEADETETAAIPEISAETSPETVQAAVAESVTEAAEQTVETVEAVQDETAATVAEATEQTANAVEQAAETVEAAQAQTVEPATETVDQVAESAMTLAAVPLAAVEAATEASRAPLTAAESSAKSLTEAVGARFTFIPTFEPLNEINATLMAFARGEGEAAVAHLQALTKAKSPAEAIRLQVSEFQRAADASLTCFSHILRSANRFSGPTRWN
ncbi:hypothetical protein ASG52_04810 [Methylobacterium sp. Leaf456]|uniref:phasin family protein n=1 Tax=Methylobacterium sp. Leaf456 TaxID=1736382 RepID=UPI0006FC549A|nr:phasin family protein [Methylobacterium sp. Leaf456]KQT53442.1 hypothetical protein ASG52_04810 [Methylobacterium sp. Leaf456]